VHTAVIFHQQPLPRRSQVNHRLKLVRKKETKATKNQKTLSQTHTKRKQANNYKITKPKPKQAEAGSRKTKRLQNAQKGESYSNE
jgi:hypothetical protein